MRRGLLALSVAAAAVLVPTAVLSGSSAQAFSVQQVQRVFAAQGLALRRQALPVLAAPFESFDHPSIPQGFDLGVTVYRAGTAPPALGRYVAYGSALPRFARRGNVLVYLSGQAADSRTWHAAERALARLRYSPADAARPQLPTIVLRQGEHRTLTERQAPLGTEVECTTGKIPVVSYGVYPAVAAASAVIQPSTRSTGAATDVTFGTGAAATKQAQLSWQPLPHGVLAFTCSATISAGQVVVNEPGGGSYGLAPPSATVSGPLPTLKLPRPDFTLRNEYANVSARTLHAMLGPG